MARSGRGGKGFGREGGGAIAEGWAGFDLGEEAGEVSAGIGEEGGAVEGGVGRDEGGLAETAGAESGVGDVGGEGVGDGVGGAIGEVGDDGLELRAGIAGGVEIEAEAVEVDDEGLEVEGDAGVAGGGVDEVLVPWAGDPEDEFGVASGLDAGGEVADEVVGGFGVDTKEGVRVGCEGEAQGRQDAEAEHGFGVEDGAMKDLGADNFLGVKRVAEAVIGHAEDGEDGEVLGFPGEVAVGVPGVMRPGGIEVGVSQPRHVLRHRENRASRGRTGRAGFCGVIVVPGAGGRVGPGTSCLTANRHEQKTLEYGPAEETWVMA